LAAFAFKMDEAEEPTAVSAATVAGLWLPSQTHRK